MPRKWPLTWLIVMMLSVSIACQISGGAAAPTQAPQPTASLAPAPTKQPSPTTNFAATDTARANAQATQEAEAQSQEKTRQAVEILQSTARVEAAATRQASDMLALVQKLHDDGYLERTQGVYYALENFDESWAQINWYQWWRTGLAPTDFVLRAHTEWVSASRTANWFASGCGFVFREEDEQNHYVIFLALDGNVYLSGLVDNVFTPISKNYYGKLENVEGSADVILIVEGSRIQYFVNGEQVLSSDNATFDHGDLGLTLLSGTNKDFGTRCKITGTEVWDISQ